MEIVPFRAGMFDLMVMQDVEAYLKPYLIPGLGKDLEGAHSWAGIVKDKVIGCGGIFSYWPGRGEAWAYLDRNCGRHFISIHRAVQRYLAGCAFRRIEAAVDSEFPAAHEWVLKLGFTVEAPVMRNYAPDGRSCTLYSLIKDT